MRNLLATCTLVACSATIALAQDAAAGKRAFSHCGNWHQVGPTARSIAAPALNGLFGRAAGSLVDYDYSEAIKGSGLIWDEDTFSLFIRDPQATIPGTKMFFHGIQDEQEFETSLPICSSSNEALLPLIACARKNGAVFRSR